jgi:hypothetical protein
VIRRGDTRPRYGSLRSIAHRAELTLPLVWLLALLVPALRPVAAGLTVHLALDLHPPNFDRRLRRRAAGRCERCGLAGVTLGAHYLRMPERGGDRWALDNRVMLCVECAREWFTRSREPRDVNHELRAEKT